jgi:DUF4097 and DUF4098 domain-containing protein YvlB
MADKVFQSARTAERTSVRTPRPILRLQVLGALCLAPLSACGLTFAEEYYLDRRGDRATREIQEELPKGVERLIVENRYGCVIIQAAQEVPRYRWEISCWARGANYAKEYADTTELRAKSDGPRTSLILTLPGGYRRFLRGVESNLVVEVPPGADVEVKNAYGQIFVRDLSGKTRVRSQNGDVELARLSGPIDAENQDGPIHVDGAGGGRIANSQGIIQAENIAGSLVVDNENSGVVIRGVTGSLTVNNERGVIDAAQIEGRAKLSTTYALLRAVDVQGGAYLRNDQGAIEAHDIDRDIDAKTAYASINVSGYARRVNCSTLQGNVNLKLQTHDLQEAEASVTFGDIIALVPPGVEPLIEAEASYGRVSSRLPIETWNKSHTRTNARGGDPTSSSKLTLRSEHGNIAIGIIP